MPTTNQYLSVFIGFSMEAGALALLLYAIVWRLVRGSGLQRVRVGRWWHVAGFLTTMFGTGAVRFLSIFIMGGKAAMELSPGHGPGMVFFIAVPALLAFGISTLLRIKADRARIAPLR